MDLKFFSNHIKPQIEAGKIVKIVRETLKEAKHQDQDVYEKQRKSMEPLTDKLEDLKEEVVIASTTPKQNHIAIPQPIRDLDEGKQPKALPSPPILIADPNYGFTEEELEKFKEYGLPSPLEAFKNNGESEAHSMAANINKNLGGQKRHSKKRSRKREQLDAEINHLRRYQDRLKLIESGHATVGKQRGKGVVFYNKPEELLDRLELLGGSIEDGNSSKEVARHFSTVAHNLRDIGVLSNPDLRAILTNYII